MLRASYRITRTVMPERGTTVPTALSDSVRTAIQPASPADVHDGLLMNHSIELH